MVMVNGNTASVDAARPPIMHQESNLSASSSSSLISNVNIRPSRTLVRSQQQSIGANSSSNADSCSNDNCSDMNSDSDSEQTARIGNAYQADVPAFCLEKPALPSYPEKAQCVWRPNPNLDKEKLNDYLSLAKDKYNWNAEQALGLLFWHRYNFDCAYPDLPNFLMYPDEWTMEDKALFEQAYQSHNKNFYKISQMLPNRKIASLVKFYYTWKKAKSRNTFVDRQLKKNNSLQTKNNDNGLVSDLLALDDGAGGNGSENEYEVHPITFTSLKEKSLNENRQQCTLCSTKSSSPFYSTSKFGLLCRTCFYSKRKSVKEVSLLADRSKNCSPADVRRREPIELPKTLSPLLANEAVLDEIAKEWEVNPHRSVVLEKMDNEITEAIRKIRESKLANLKSKEEISQLGDPFQPANANPNRTISRWTNDECIMFTYAIRDHGKDFKKIAELFGTKTEANMRNYYLQNNEKYKFDQIIAEHNKEHDLMDAPHETTPSSILDKDIVEESASPATTLRIAGAK